MHSYIPLILRLSFLFIALFALSQKAAADCAELLGSKSRDQLQEQHQDLLDTIQTHNELYEAGQPVISDEEYDALTQQQRELGRCLGDVVRSDILPPLDNRHRYPMGSLKKADDQEDILDFLETAQRLGSPVLLQPKIDGVAVELVYQGGELVQALTRGQWRTGKGLNLLPIMPFIPSVPDQLPSQRKEVVIRGELFTPANNPATEGSSTPRHYVAGLINRKQPAPAELKKLQFFPWQWSYSPLASLRSNNRQLNEWGFSDTAAFTHPVKTLDDILYLRQKYNKEQSALDALPLDGIVLKLDNLTIQKRLGHLDGTPYWALAWKFPAKQAVTEVKRVYWTIGRTGQVTTLLELQPVTIQGITVQNVHIGPVDYLSSLDIAAGDSISVKLKGAATPVFGKVITRPEYRKLPTLPDTTLFNPMTCLTYTPHCKEQFSARLQWLTARTGLSQVVSSTQIQQGINNGSLTTLIDLLKSTPRPDISLADSIRALGIPEVGRKRSELLAEKGKNWKTIQNVSVDNLKSWLKVSTDEAETIKRYLKLQPVKTLGDYLLR